MDHNDQTKSAYDSGVQKYLDGGIAQTEGDLKVWLDDALGKLPLGAKVLEVGAATGRDSLYMQAKGFEVVAADLADGFIEHLQSLGLQTSQFDLLGSDWPTGFDVVVAIATFLHFEPDDLATILARAKVCLNENGMLAFTVKEGDGPKWSDHKLDEPRYFYMWQANELTEFLDTNGWQVLDYQYGQTGYTNSHWHQITATPKA